MERRKKRGGGGEGGDREVQVGEGGETDEAAGKLKEHHCLLLSALLIPVILFDGIRFINN